MALLGELTGQGAVIVGGKRFEGIPYYISVSRTRNKISGAGRIEMPSIDDIKEMFRFGRVTLELQTGERVELKAVEAIEPSTVVEVRTTGPIPGY